MNLTGKLIKKGEEYHLWVDQIVPKIVPFAQYPWDATKQRLSLKNCQVIERGYDLEELACKEIKIDISVINHIDEKLKENSSPCTPSKEGGCVGSNLYNQVKGFQKGFQKALELLGDKKYSEKDVLNLLSDYGYDLLYADKLFEGTPKQWMEQSLQQTEWDVEIVMEPCFYDNSLGGFSTSYKEGMPTEQPKLDADGCLILIPLKK